MYRQFVGEVSTTISSWMTLIQLYDTFFPPQIISVNLFSSKNANAHPANIWLGDIYTHTLSKQTAVFTSEGIIIFVI